KLLYEKGRRAESQSMGIAAYAYYRRVVENRKNQIIEAFITVAQKVGASRELLDDLEAAKKETQFTNAIRAIKHAIPDSLMIEGHNPLVLLHDTLSDGLHGQSD